MNTNSKLDPDIIWEDRSRILGMPISFTRYSMSEEQLTIRTGMLNLRTETIKFFRVVDMAITQSLWQRIFGVGSITLATRDARQSEFIIQNVKSPEKVHKMLDMAVEAARNKHRIRTSEFMTSDPDDSENNFE